MTGSHGFVTTIDGCRLAWRSDGPAEAPVLVLSNSLGTSMAMWDDQATSIASRFRVLRYDTRGHGGSTATSGDYSLDRLGRDAIEVLDALSIERAHFCGLSLGGMTGQWLGIYAPERIGRLVIANSSSFLGPPHSWQDRMELVRSQGMASITQAVLDRWFTSGFTTSNASKLERTRAQLLATPPEGYAGCCAAIRDMDLRPVVHLIERPTLVIGGSVDPATPPHHAEAMANAVSGARLVMLEAAHLSNVEQPEVFTAALLDFLG